mgnify:CR=1 FL=1
MKSRGGRISLSRLSDTVPSIGIGVVYVRGEWLQEMICSRRQPVYFYGHGKSSIRVPLEINELDGGPYTYNADRIAENADRQSDAFFFINQRSLQHLRGEPFEFYESLPF